MFMENEREKMFEDNIPLVYFLVKKYYPTFAGNEDVIQEGKIGLWQGVQTYDESKGKLSSYLASCIINGFRNYIRKEMKHVGTLSLDYTYEEDCPMMESVVGEEDILNVSWLDADVFIKSLTGLEKTVFDYVKLGYTQTEVAEVLGYTHQYIGLIHRNIKSKWRKYIDR